MDNKIIDIHVHFGAPKDEQSGCYWSKKFESTLAYLAMLLMTKSLLKKIDIKRIKKHLLGKINGSKNVHQTVLLALDQVYDQNGIVHPRWTHLYVPNTYIARLADEHDRVLFGASVHPYRNDWEPELQWCIEHNAKLCKWIPSSQMIDLRDSRCIPFYKKLAKHNLPLLCHAGPEYAIPTSNNDYIKFNNPKYLRTALDLGVTVIVAHCATPVFGAFDTEYHDDFDEFLKLFEDAVINNWNLYADLSAVCSLFRIKYVEKVKQRLQAIASDKLIFGSDYPIPLSELCYNTSQNFFSWIKFLAKVIFIRNPLDKNYHLIKGMGFGDSVFINADKLFSLIKRDSLSD